MEFDNDDLTKQMNLDDGARLKLHNQVTSPANYSIRGQSLKEGIELVNTSNMKRQKSAGSSSGASRASRERRNQVRNGVTTTNI